MIYLLCILAIHQAKKLSNQLDQSLILSGPHGPHGPVDPFDYCLDNKCQKELKDCSHNLDCQLTIQKCQEEYSNSILKIRIKQAKVLKQRKLCLLKNQLVKAIERCGREYCRTKEQIQNSGKGYHNY